MSAPAEIIDVSQAQLGIDWVRVKAAGVTTAIIRASQGVSQVDKACAVHLGGAHAAGLQLGVYHALIASWGGVNQAEHFLKVVEAFRADFALPLVIDAELQNGMAPARIAETLYGMASTLEQATGAKPMLYTSPGFFNSYVGQQHDLYFAAMPLWIAHWTTAAKPLLPRCWHDYALWQFTSSGQVDGVHGHVDLSRKR